jgi:hypothetical protein
MFRNVVFSTFSVKEESVFMRLPRCLCVTLIMFEPVGGLLWNSAGLSWPLKVTSMPYVFNPVI